MCKRLFSLIVIALLVFEISVIPAHATILGMDTYDLSEEEKSVVIQTANLEVVDADDHKEGIRCFDVKQDGSYALAVGTGSNSRVYVYDSNSTFLYGYKFYCDGDYAIEFQNDLLAIYFLRGNTIAFYDTTGMCASVQKVATTNANNICIKEILDRTSKDIGDKLYILERDIDIGGSYSRLVSVGNSGERTVLFDVSSEHTIGQVISILAVCGFFLFVIVVQANKFLSSKT